MVLPAPSLPLANMIVRAPEKCWLTRYVHSRSARSYAPCATRKPILARTRRSPCVAGSSLISCVRNDWRAARRSLGTVAGSEAGAVAAGVVVGAGAAHVERLGAAADSGVLRSGAASTSGTTCSSATATTPRACATPSPPTWWRSSTASSRLPARLRGTGSLASTRPASGCRRRRRGPGPSGRLRCGSARGRPPRPARARRSSRPRSSPRPRHDPPGSIRGTPSRSRRG